MKGIVYNTTTGKVNYKFDTPTLPSLNVNEAIKERQDIDQIEAGAIYDSNTDTYINRVNIPTQKNWKYLYQNAATDAAKLDVIAKFLKLK